MYLQYRRRDRVRSPLCEQNGKVSYEHPQLSACAVNYGGSTGYGREYRNRLRKNWGVVDVDDCCNAAKHLAREGKADEQRLCISGGSAGGYTTLACLAFK